MTWLKYTDDEVMVFHPEFEIIGNEVLKRLGLTGVYEWKHHPRSAGVGVIPDFILRNRATKRWLLVVEIKRSRSSVFSARSQIQAKGYAEANGSLYMNSRPHYFCVTNLESSLLFAVNGSTPVRECRIKDMAFDSGQFSATSVLAHKAALSRDLEVLVNHVLTTPAPVFDVVWPRIAREVVSTAASLQYDPIIDLGSTVLPAVVSDYFTSGTVETAKLELLLRCLIAEYLKGILRRYGHRRSTTLPALSRNVKSASIIVKYLSSIDFKGIFEANASELYLKLAGIPFLKLGVENYLQSLITERVDLLAMRHDALEFTEAFLAEAYTHQTRNAKGKAQTDPELAALLATLSIGNVNAVVLDPGCGDGNLLSAAYDRLQALGATHPGALKSLKGLDADAIATKVAALRLALKEPLTIRDSDPNRIEPGDMFSSASAFADVDVVLLNPPFKRYEAQDDAPIPQPLRDHFRLTVTNLSGSVETDTGQANLYNLYVEFVVKASNAGTVFGIILDNRWYHNKVAENLRALLLRECEIQAIVSYPHGTYFHDWTIATSILIARKTKAPQSHSVHFIRTSDPRAADFNDVAQALKSHANYPADWHVNIVPQTNLTQKSWQQHFSKAMVEDFRIVLPRIHQLFKWNRRGSLAKEGGGIAVFEMPFGRTTYGHKRTAMPRPRAPFKNKKGRALDSGENAKLRDLTNSIPQGLRGYAVNKADRIAGYRLTVADVNQDQVLETPIQRTVKVSRGYHADERRAWDKYLDRAIAQIKSNPNGNAYVKAVARIIGLKVGVLSKQELWNVLREPYAGELILPRKLRNGHRVHINPFAYMPVGRQVRLSSNFFSYGGCLAIDSVSALDRQTAVKLIAAFLMSSFGQVNSKWKAQTARGPALLSSIMWKRLRFLIRGGYKIERQS